jgi:hypothetical protein
MACRSYGTGNLRARGGVWYGQWWVGERRVQRKIGPVRQPGTRQGLTKRQAGARLRALMQEVKPAPASER